MALTKARNIMIKNSAANVVDYGADNTGASDSSSAIQAAIDSGANRIFIPEGTYSLNSLITVNTDKIIIYGDFPVIKINNTSGGFLFSSCQEALIQDIEVTTELFSGQNLSVGYALKFQNCINIRAENVAASWCQKGIWVLNDFSDGTDTTSVKLDQCQCYGNDINLYCQNDDSNYRVYGITVIGGDYNLAWNKASNGADGAGMHFFQCKEVVLINCVAQSNGYNGANMPGSFSGTAAGMGYGKGLILDQCRRVRSMQFHAENHDTGLTGQDITISGSAANPSFDVHVNGTGKLVRIDDIVDAYIDIDRLAGLSLGTGLQNVRLKIHSAVSSAIYDLINNADGIVSFEQYGTNDSETFATNFKNGASIDQSYIASPTFIKGKLKNLLGNTLAPWSSGAWTVSNATKAQVTTDSGPHGVIDLTTTRLASTGAAGYTQKTAPLATWDGEYCFLVWVRQDTAASNANFVLYLRSSIGGDITAATYTATDTWKPYAIRGSSSDGGSITVRITAAGSGEQFDFWGPTLTEGLNPTTTSFCPDNTPVDFLGSGFPGGIFLGPYISRMTAYSAAPSSGPWRQGDIVYNSAPSAGGTVGWVCVTGGTPGTWKTFGTITA